jgi:hypothetical protein
MGVHSMPSAARITVALAVLVALSAPVDGQGRPDCAAVVRQLNKVSGRNGSETPDPARIASKLGVDPAWVERCALSYGRRVKRHHPKRADGERDEEGLTAKREEQEYEELAREERDQQANQVQEDLRSGVYATRRGGAIVPDSSAEWEPYITHEWQPKTTHEWMPFIRDDDDPGFE